MSQKPFKVFYVTDIHGSEICWRKFPNAGTFYQAETQRWIEMADDKVTDPSRMIFNFHAPPYRSGLDEAPGLDETST